MTAEADANRGMSDLSNTALRVGYFVNRYPAGSHTFIRREIRALERLGVEVVRYALRPGSQSFVDPEDVLEKERTNFVVSSGALVFAKSVLHFLFTRPWAFFAALRTSFRVGWRSDRGVALHFAYLAEAAVLASWARRDRIQHLHAHFGTNSTAIAMLARQLSGLPFSFTAHGPEEFEKAQWLHLEAKLEMSEFAVCVSQFGRSQLMRWSRPELWPKIKLVHCGLDDKFLAGPPPPIPQEPRFTCVGRLSVEKAQLVLVAAVRRLRDEGLPVKVTLVGDGPLREPIKDAIGAAGLEDAITLLGWGSGDRVKQAISDARALVLPSFAENLPVVIMEAMALGRPVISTYVAGIPELVEPGKTGWLAPAGDDAALALAIRAAVETPTATLAAMGAAGRDSVLRSHDSLKEAAKLKDLFEAVGLSEAELLHANVWALAAICGADPAFWTFPGLVRTNSRFVFGHSRETPYSEVKAEGVDENSDHAAGSASI